MLGGLSGDHNFQLTLRKTDDATTDSWLIKIPINCPVQLTADMSHLEEQLNTAAMRKFDEKQHHFLQFKYEVRGTSTPYVLADRVTLIPAHQPPLSTSLWFVSHLPSTEYVLPARSGLERIHLYCRTDIKIIQRSRGTVGPVIWSLLYCTCYSRLLMSMRTTHPFSCCC